MQRYWDPICETDVLYDDGQHQEATMSVLRDGHVERIRIVRFRAPDAIDFFNPQPPDSMHFHRGSWEFQPGGAPGQTTVIARREYELIRDPSEAPDRYAARCLEFERRLEARLRALLEALRTFIETAKARGLGTVTGAKPCS